MPTYQYACTECDHHFEAVQAFSDASLTVCPQCQGRLRKVYGSVGVVFKGSGFYRTDSRSGSQSASVSPGSKSDKSSESSAKSESSANSNGKASGSESKPAASSSTPSSSTPAKAAS